MVSSSGSSENNRLANTKERDFSIGLDNHGFRYFDPEAGRYVSRDPIGYRDGMNVYVYVGNNPINFVDPLGLNVVWSVTNRDYPKVQAIMERVVRMANEMAKKGNKAPLHALAKIFSKRTATAKVRVVVDLTEEDVDKLTIGDFFREVIDVDQMERLGSDPSKGRTTESAFLHEMYEQWLKAKSGKTEFTVEEAYALHKKALALEECFLGLKYVGESLYAKSEVYDKLGYEKWVKWRRPAGIDELRPMIITETYELNMQYHVVGVTRTEEKELLESAEEAVASDRQDEIDTRKLYEGMAKFWKQEKERKARESQAVEEQKKEVPTPESSE